MESTIVIKVKFGSTLRRFNAPVIEEQLDLNMVRLREKIHGLFNFAHDADFTLTYVDEDGDVVTLADEDDLCDVVKQSLNPLRITVMLNPEKKTRRSYAISSGNSTPMRSPRGQDPMQNVNFSVSEILKSVPEPLREVFSKLLADVAAKCSSSGPGVAGLAELVDNFSKVGLAFLGKNPNVQADQETSATSAASESTAITSEIEDQPVMKVAVPLQEKLPETKPGASTLNDNQSPLETTSIGKEVGVKMAVQRVDGTAFQPPGFPSYYARSMPVDRHIASKSEEVKGFGWKKWMPNTASESTVHASDMIGLLPSKVSVVPREKLLSLSTNTEVSTPKDNQNLLETSSISKEVGFKRVVQGVDDTAVPLPGFPSSKASAMPEGSHIASKNEVDGFGWNMWNPIGGDVPTAALRDWVKQKKVNVDGTGFGTSNPDYLKRCLQDSQTMGVDRGLSARPNESGSSSAWHCGPNSSNESILLSPYSSMADVQPYNPHVAPFKRSYNHEHGISSIFHRGVRCDGCGVHPITGPRFKSEVKDDYDLCSGCFAGMGNEFDYIRIDRPWAPQLPIKGMHDPSRIRPPSVPQSGFRLKSTKFKLDSRFIQDVNVLDGTIMAPLTPFTKIWRMRNNGNTVWPQGSQLLWIGGDSLSEALTLEVEIPAEGLPVDKELDIAVDFVAPELPGRYVSYWRMASPSGQKFGQRVWVLIQVDASLKNTSGVINGFNLNLPPVSSSPTAHEINSMKVEPLVEGSFSEPYRVTELIEPTVDAHLKKDPELSFPINDTLLVGGGGASSNVNPGPSSVSYPIVDFSPVSFPVELAPAGQESAVVEVNVNADREEFLLRELEVMGFKRADLNKEILRMNEYDLEQSVDALCGVSEWDPILEELHEMGFCDDETNKRLLKKHNGSIKHVVLDLICGENDA